MIFNMKFRKKPVIIEAIQYLGNDNLDVVLNFIGRDKGTYIPSRQKNVDPVIATQTLEGCMTANKGDWIIRGVKGEYYPCKPDIFKAIYEAVEEG